MNIIGQVSNVELTKSTKNKKGKSIGFTGIIIEVETDDVVTDGNIVEINVGGKLRFFTVYEISTNTTTSKSIAFKAKETGYFANRVSHNTLIDITTLLGVDVSLVTDPDRINTIKEASFFC